jgi:rare lipoprotein A (peptidoglycan hydrolase)
LALCGSFVVVPLLSLVHRASAGSATTTVAASAADPALARQFFDRASRSQARAGAAGLPLVERTGAALTTAVTSESPVASEPTVAAATVASFRRRRVVVTPQTTVARPAPRTTPAPAPVAVTRPAPPRTTLPPPPPPPRNVQSGLATWLDTIPAGTCANNAAPMGAVLTVTDVYTGQSVTCQVVSRGPFGPGRVIDLAKNTFAQLAPPSQGLIDVRVTW